MAVEVDPAAEFAEFAHPERLVSGDWLEAHLGTPGLVVVESDEDVLLYETGHIRTAVKIDWHTDLNDPVAARLHRRRRRFAALLGSKGITPRHHRRHLRRQEQLVGRVRPLGLHALRPRGRASARRRPRQVGGRRT